jgi:broad specificity phosphatase PhoE
MACFFLVRHGEVEGNQAGRSAFIGWHDLALTKRGVIQSQAIAQRLQCEKLAAVYSSDLQRAVVTAERIATLHGLKVSVSPDLREVNYGAWESLGEAEIVRDWKTEWQARLEDPIHTDVPQGESYMQLWYRFLPAWLNIVQTHSGADENVVLVGHNGTLRLLLCYLLGMPFENYRRIQLDNCGLTRVRMDNDSIRVLSVNQTDFLEDTL